jgi:hypothetical protein
MAYYSVSLMGIKSSGTPTGPTCEYRPEGRYLKGTRKSYHTMGSFTFTFLVAAYGMVRLDWMPIKE